MTFQTRVTEQGQVSLPPELAREMGLKPGDWLQLDREGNRLVIKSYREIVREAQDKVRAMLPADYTGGLVDELIADRRAEAAREDAEFEDWGLSASFRSSRRIGPGRRCPSALTSA